MDIYIDEEVYKWFLAHKDDIEQGINDYGSLIVLLGAVLEEYQSGYYDNEGYSQLIDEDREKNYCKDLKDRRMIRV